jgi:ABC-type nitrate/sulfonate/bicarbonate transport system ATPase subunit
MDLRVKLGGFEHRFPRQLSGGMEKGLAARASSPASRFC